MLFYSKLKSRNKVFCLYSYFIFCYGWTNFLLFNIWA